MKTINIVLLFIIMPLIITAQSTAHAVEAGQTFYSIAKMYNITIDGLKANNPNVDQNNMPIGTVLNIYAQPANATTTSNSINNNSPIYHTVAKGETLFGLAKRTYNVPVNDIISWNNLTDNTLSIGQNLIIGWANGAPSYTNNTAVKNTNTAAYTTATMSYPSTQPTSSTPTPPTSAVNNPTPLSEGKVVYVSNVPSRGDLTDLKDSRTVYTSTIPSTSAITNSSNKYTTATPEPITNNATTTNPTPANNVINTNTTIVESTVAEPDVITKKYGSIATGGKLLPREIFKSLAESNDPSLVLKKEEGAAKWFDLEDKSIQLYAIHATAPIGSALKITNPINQTTIYAKVIDTLTPSADNANTLLRLSTNAMSILKMYDKAFMVNIEYFDIVNK